MRVSRLPFKRISSAWFCVGGLCFLASMFLFTSLTDHGFDPEILNYATVVSMLIGLGFFYLHLSRNRKLAQLIMREGIDGEGVIVNEPRVYMNENSSDLWLELFVEVAASGPGQHQFVSRVKQRVAEEGRHAFTQGMSVRVKYCPSRNIAIVISPLTFPEFYSDK